jgi:hypothetical protein
MTQQLFAMPINQKLVNVLVKELVSKAGFLSSQISTEIQEDGLFLLITITGVGRLEAVPEPQVLIAQAIVDRAVPRRSGEYSWMINFTRYGAVVNSVFGGDSESPLSGLL